MTVANVSVRQILLKRGTTVRSLAYTGPAGEVTIDTDLKSLRIHDGATPGGWIVTANGTGGSGNVDSTVTNAINANVTAANLQITALWANAAAQATSITSLISNAGSQATSITTLTANAATQAGYITTLQGQVYSNANVAAYLTANPQGSTYSNVNVQAYLGANVGAYQTWANLTFSTVANAGTQQTQINLINANVSAANATIASLQLETYSNTNTIAYLAGNVTTGNLTVAQNAVILGNLQVVGTQTTVNTTTLTVNDLFVTVANGAINSSQANGAGLRVAGALANIAYSSVTDSFEFNKSITVGNLIFSNNTRFFNNNVSLPNSQGFNWHFNDPMIGSSTTTLYYNGLTTGFDSWALETGNGSNAWILDSDTQEFYLFNGSGTDGKLVFGTATNASTGSVNDIELKSTVGNVYITANAEPWTFRQDGNLFLPNNMIFTSSPAVSGTGIIFGDSTYQHTAWTGTVDKLQNEVHNATLDSTGNLTVPGSILPNADNVYDLGSATMRFRHLYVGPGTVYVGNAAIKTTVTGNLILPGLTRAVASSAFVEEIEDEGDQSYSFATNPTIIDNAQFELLSGGSVSSFTPATYSSTGIDGQGYIRNITVDTPGSGYANDVAVLAEQNMWATEAADPVNNFDSNDWVQIPFRAETRAGESEYEFSTGGGADTGNITFDNNEIGSSGDFVNIVGDEYAQLQSNGNYVWVDNSGAHIEINEGGVFDFEHVGGVTRLKLPAGGDIVDSTGTSVLGGSGTTGNVVFDGDQLYVGGTGFLDLKNNANQVELGSNNTGSLILSVDEGTQRWEFGANGSMIFPDNTVQTTAYIGSGNTSSTTNQLVNDEYTVVLQSNGAVTIPGTIISGGTDPTAYRGFYAAVNQISEQGGGSEDDPSLNQIILSRSANMRGYNLSDDTNDDTFFANGITGSSHVAVINLYGEDTSNPLDLADIKIFVQTYIDLVLYDGTTLRTDVADIQTAFAAAQTDLVDSLPTNALRSDFKFNEIQAVINTAGMTTSGSGSGFVYYYNTDTADYSGSDETDILVAGAGYQINDTITVPGTALGGIAPADNMTITVAGVDGSGGITSIDRSGSMDSGRFANLFVKHFIIEGYDDAYDQGNGIGTDRSECVFVATANSATERITVSAVTSGELAPFQAFSQDNDYNYMILHQVSGTAGGTGVYVTGGYDTIDDEATATTYTANGIYYGINDPQYDSPAFGGGDYVSMVNTEVGIFTMVAVNADIDRVSYIGETGADSDGIKILTASFDIGNGTVESLPVELVVGNDTWTFENTGNLTLPQTSGRGITFGDGTFQKTAYKRPDNLMLDGGGAATIYEVTVDYAEGGFSSTRYGVNTPSFNGGGAEATEPTYYTLDGGGA